jgi:hypothetical protein
MAVRWYGGLVKKGVLGDRIRQMTGVEAATVGSLLSSEVAYMKGKLNKRTK